MHPSDWREKIWKIIFEADTPAGKAFDVILIWSIILSVLCVMLESVSSFAIDYGIYFYTVEWIFTGLFTIEYILRLICVDKPAKYAYSFFGIIDLLAILPTFLSSFIVGAQSLLVIRSFRLLRVFRVFKLTHYFNQADILKEALVASKPKITVFIVGVMATVITVGALMYLIEGGENGFDNIPRSVYWAIVTMTTVGYGDIIPQTLPGQMLASVLMLLGYGVLAVPTGIVSVELARASKSEEKGYLNQKFCEECSKYEQDPKAKFCKFCGQSL